MNCNTTPYGVLCRGDYNVDITVSNNNVDKYFLLALSPDCLLPRDFPNLDLVVIADFLINHKRVI